METLIARICAPALAGIKPSNLAAVDKVKYPTFCAELVRLNRALGTRGIRMKIVCECPRKVLVLVYRTELLERTLQNTDIAAILGMFGYRAGAPLEEQLHRLRCRMKEEEFPHEIGAFLGYPPADIRGFLSDRRDGVLLVGEWKVYADADRAAALFARFDACRRGVARRMQSGQTLAQIFAA